MVTPDVETIEYTNVLRKPPATRYLPYIVFDSQRYEPSLIRETLAIIQARDARQAMEERQAMMAMLEQISARMSPFRGEVSEPLTHG